jgi:hypothetical protein
MPVSRKDSAKAFLAAANNGVRDMTKPPGRSDEKSQSSYCRQATLDFLWPDLFDAIAEELARPPWALVLSPWGSSDYYPEQSFDLKPTVWLAVEVVIGELVSTSYFPVPRENTGKFCHSKP